ncbi:hypothetical protein R1X32_07355 (plasmid) [Rhodococcus opacus]|uniref:hypothetical protein n=1 Tax=Rhodococcus opacus TaxID=37919 RepID=UPI0034D30F61
MPAAGSGTAMVAAALEQDGRLTGHHGALLSRALADTTTAGADAIAVGYYAKAVIAPGLVVAVHEVGDAIGASR